VPRQSLEQQLIERHSAKQKYKSNVCRSIPVDNRQPTAMEQHTLKNVNNCLTTTIYYYLDISFGQSSNLYLNVVRFFNTSVNLTSVAALYSFFCIDVCFIKGRN
jgi:hypothetical protein